MIDQRQQAGQRAETIARSMNDLAIKRMNGRRRRSSLIPGNHHGRRPTVDDPLREADPARAGRHRLRELAAWYRRFAERAGNPVIWEARLRTAEELDAEADRIEGGPRSALD